MNQEYYSYYTNFVDNPIEILKKLLVEVPFVQREVKVYNKYVKEPRLTSFHATNQGGSYRYSGKLCKPDSMTPTLEELRSKVSEYLGVEFNAVLCNLYRDGKDYLCYHSDDERDLKVKVIASLSFGAVRTFKFRDRQTKTEHDSIDLQPGSLIIMKEGCQKKFEHGVPKRLKVKEPRVNLTFRIT